MSTWNNQAGLLGGKAGVVDDQLWLPAPLIRLNRESQLFHGWKIFPSGKEGKVSFRAEVVFPLGLCSLKMLLINQHYWGKASVDNGT